MKAHPISKLDFDKLEAIRQIIVHAHAHRYACLDLGELGSYGLSWRSQEVEPIVDRTKVGSLVWVGIDQQLAAINLSNGRLALVMPTTSNIVQLFTSIDFTVVLTEQEIFLFNSNGSLRFNYGLPEVGEEITRRDKNLEIRLMDGTSLMLNPQTGTVTDPKLV